jgi:methylmalonyl-CoA mutase
VIPKQDYAALLASGAACIFGPGTVITDAARELIAELERRQPSEGPP